jgi:hypothetical protein
MVPPLFSRVDLLWPLGVMKDHMMQILYLYLYHVTLFFLTRHVVILDIGAIIYMSHSLVLGAL